MLGRATCRVFFSVLRCSRQTWRGVPLARSNGLSACQTSDFEHFIYVKCLAHHPTFTTPSMKVPKKVKNQTTNLPLPWSLKSSNPRFCHWSPHVECDFTSHLGLDPELPSLASRKQYPPEATAAIRLSHNAHQAGARRGLFAYTWSLRNRPISWPCISPRSSLTPERP